MSAETAAQAALRSRVVTLQTAIAADAAAARTALALATQLRGQGDTAFQAGQNEEKAKNYTDALTSYTTAQKSYTDSLEQQRTPPPGLGSRSFPTSSIGSRRRHGPRTSPRCRS
jgi:hypothetical protein